MTRTPLEIKPLAIDLFCGLGGWAEGLLAAGYGVIGYDIEAHDYGTGGYPGTLILQDVTTLHGSQFAQAALIVASPPCQAYSYRAMPWSRAKALPPPDNTLFETCFRLQREASAAAGRHIPMVAENVRGAQKWVGPAKWHYGSFYLWGDVPALMPISHAVKVKTPSWSNYAKTGEVSAHWRLEGLKNSGGSWFNIPGPGGTVAGQNPDGRKTSGHVNIRDGHSHTRHLTNQCESDGVKFSQSGHAWFDGTPRDKVLGDQGPAAFGSKSKSRKMASAIIAKIPFPLALHIARAYYPPPSTSLEGELHT